MDRPTLHGLSVNPIQPTGLSSSGFCILVQTHLKPNVVAIINRESYTTVRKAWSYIRRGLAEIVETAGSSQLVSIRMLEIAELALLKSHVRQQYDPVKGNFAWHVADSGGSAVVQNYAGVSGGMRGYQARHRN